MWELDWRTTGRGGLLINQYGETMYNPSNTVKKIRAMVVSVHRAPNLPLVDAHIISLKPIVKNCLTTSFVSLTSMMDAQHQLIYATFETWPYTKLKVVQPFERCLTQIPMEVFDALVGKITVDEFELFMNRLDALNNKAASKFIWSTLIDETLLEGLFVRRRPCRIRTCFPDELGSNAMTNIINFQSPNETKWFVNYVVQVLLTGKDLQQKASGYNPIFETVCSALSDLNVRDESLYETVRNLISDSFNADIRDEFPLMFYDAL